MPELSVSPDPSVWSLVPHRDDAPAWIHALTRDLPDAQKVQVAGAAELALQTREAVGEGMVLLLSEPTSGLAAALTLLVTAAPAVTDIARATELALAVSPSAWTPTVAPFELNDMPGWRVSVLGTRSGVEDAADPVTLLDEARVTYVFALSDRLSIAQLSPLAPAAAAVAMALTEQMLPTLEVTDSD